MAILILLALLQARRLSLAVIILAAIAFIAGLALVIYFYKRFKAAEKQPEDDWQAGMHALFAQQTSHTSSQSQPPESANRQSPSAARLTEASVASALYPETASPELDLPDIEALQEAPPPQQSKEELRPSVDIGVGATRKPYVESQSGGLSPSSEPQSHQPSPASPLATQELGSLSLDSVQINQPPVHDKPQTGIDTVQTPVPRTREVKVPDSKTAGLTGSDSTAQVRSARPTSLFDASRTASLEGQASSPPGAGLTDKRIPYEPPSIDQVKSGQVIKREPYQRPMIAPLEPRDQPPDKPMPDKARLDQVVSRPVDPRPTREASTPAISPGVPLRPTAGHELPDAVVAGNLAAAGTDAWGARQSRAPHGSVLGIPAVVSAAPMRLGEPVRDSKEEGIGGLVNYGKPQDAGGGRAGLIALGVVSLAIAVAVLIYLFVPSIHNGVDEWLARVRGRDAESLAAADNRPKARVVPRSSQADKNIAKAAGSIENITNPPEPLENLEVEVTLVRAGDETENRRVPVTPSVLESGQRGQYEFEYDGDRTTGFAKGYKIVKLWSGDREIRFTSPVLSTAPAGAADGSAPRR